MIKSTVPSRDCKITLQSVVEELKMLDLSSYHLLTSVDIWLVLDALGESWGIYKGWNPSREGAISYLGRSRISSLDLSDSESLEIVAAELIDDLTECFTTNELPELLRD